MVLIKTDAAGGIEWSKAYAIDFGTHEAYDVVVAVNGGYALCGYGSTVGMHVLRINVDGSVLWAKSYGAGSGVAQAIASTPDSGFVVAGRTSAYGFAVLADGQHDAFVVKMDQDGGLQWGRAFGTNTLSEEFYGVVPTSDGGYATPGAGRCCLRSCATSPTGASRWATRPKPGNPKTRRTPSYPRSATWGAA